MAKKKFSGGLNSLLGEPQRAKEAAEQNQKHQRKKLLRLAIRHQRERNKSYFYSE
jgi:hypothetical protein